jgi:PBP superfamily domain
MRSTLRKGAVTIVGASALMSLVLGGTAAADPDFTNDGAKLSVADGGFLPDANDLVTVGSDTTQFVINSAAQDYSLFEAGDVRWASFNALQPGIEQPGGQVAIVDPDQGVDGNGNPVLTGDETLINRPNGSGAGITELCNNPIVDIARSSRARGSAACEQNLYFIPALTDGLSYVVSPSAGNDLRNLDASELGAIYRCEDTRFHPKLPQVNSGTRTFFLGQIGVAESQIGTCVDQTVQEHDASAVANDALALAPISTARYVNNPADPVNPPSNIADLAADAPTAGVFFASRTVFNVVRKTEFDATGSLLKTILGQGGWLCNRFATDGVARQGFGVASTCGVPQ